MFQTAIKTITVTRIIRILVLTIVFSFIICSSSDGDSDQNKTVFEGWERPLIPYETMEEDSNMIETEVPTEIFDMQTQNELITEQDPIVTEKIIDQNTQSPVTITLDQMVESDIFSYKITVNQWNKSSICGILLILYTEEDGEIYEVNAVNIPEGLNFSFIINDNRAVVLIDGCKKNDEDDEKINFFALAKTEFCKLYVKVVDYKEIS